MTTLEPTHKCFDDAMEFLGIISKEGRSRIEDWRLVHALCRAPNGEAFAHAWCERDNAVVSAFVLYGKHTYLEIDKEGFYKVFQPFDVERYTMTDATRLNIEQVSYGPWEQRFKDACSSDRRTLGSTEVQLDRE